MTDRVRPRRNEHADGYRGIWFALGQFDGRYGDKYSGGLGTYTTKHVPMAVYDPRSDRTFFTYGGTRRDERDLLVMASYYEHETHRVPRPTVVDPKPEPDPAYDSQTVVDPHDNATIALDGDGYVWIFVAGRSRKRSGRIYRSEAPGEVTTFELIGEREFLAYPQPWWLGDRFFLCFTIYDGEGSRELFWDTGAADLGSDPSKLAGFGGHYQVSEAVDGAVYTAFNWHPDGVPDRRTNLYFARSRDGERWRAADGTPLEPPITEPDTPALVTDYRALDRLVYLKDLAVDGNGNPALLHVTSSGHEPGPENDPRHWRIARWTGRRWRTETVTTSDHNYDSGSLFAGDDEWTVIGPTAPGQRRYHTGGEIEIRTRLRDGRRWQLTERVTRDSPRNHAYARRVRDHSSPFAAFWADGDPARPSSSRLYFADLDGNCWQLPAKVDGDSVEPLKV